MPPAKKRASVASSSTSPAASFGAEGMGALIGRLARPSSSHDPTDSENVKKLCVLLYDFLRADTREAVGEAGMRPYPHIIPVMAPLSGPT